MKIVIAILLLLTVSARADTRALSLAEAQRAAFERNWDLLAVMLCAAEWSPRRC